MKSNNYQFSFNLGPDPKGESEENVIQLLIKDIFPSLQAKSLTFTLFLFSLIPFAIEITQSSILPEPQFNQKNLVLLLLSYLCRINIFLRIGSQYQKKLGLKLFTIIIVIIQIINILGIAAFHNNKSFLVMSNSTVLSIYILSIIDLNKLKQKQIIQFQRQTKSTVQNCDLLDLNDTIIKLKPRDTHFIYESYTNREFYYHNMAITPEKPKSNAKRLSFKTINNPSLSNIIQQPSTSSETLKQIKIYKLILFHFIIYANQTNSQFAIFLATEVLIYALLTVKIMKKLIF